MNITHKGIYMNCISCNLNIETISEAFFHITQYSNDEIIVTDEKFNVIFYNKKILNGEFKITDLLKNNINKNLIRLFYNFKKSGKTHIFFKLLYTDEQNNFKNVPINIHICKIKNNNKITGYSIVIQDITQELKNKIQKETFIDIITHDLKNPMRANIQILELILKNKFGQVGENLKSVLDELLNSCRFMNYMADNLLIKYKNEFTLCELRKEMYSIVKLVKDKCNNLLNVIERKHQTIEFIVKGDIQKINIDVEEIGKVLNNLIINASEQSCENSKIIVQIEKEMNNIVVSFIDSGYPKSQESLSQIFEEYITCANKFRKIGFGLELYNCKKIIEAHNGKIWAKNSNNNGSAIVFSLPIK